MLHDAADRAISPSRILDEIEPDEVAINQYREAARKHIAFLFSTIQFFLDAKSDRESKLRQWAAAKSLGHPAAAEMSDAEIARLCGYGDDRAAVNKHVMAYSRGHRLPPSLSQKSEAARQTYSAARTAQLSKL